MAAAHVVHFPCALSVVPRPVNVVFGLGTGICVRMRTKLENGVLHNEQQLQSVVISAHHHNYVFGHNSLCTEWFCFPCRILVVSTIYFCLTPFSTLHLKEKKWCFGNTFLVPFGNSDVIISHVKANWAWQLR